MAQSPFHRASWADRSLPALRGMSFGTLLFLGSFALLYWNEGRLDLSGVALRTIVISESAPPTLPAGSSISLSGKITGLEPIGDKLYLKEGNYVAVKRQVDMFSWVEQRKKKHSQASASYRYKKSWVDSGQVRRDFHDLPGHENPVPPLLSQEFRSSQIKIGMHNLQLEGLVLPLPQKIQPSADTLVSDLLTPEAALPPAAASTPTEPTPSGPITTRITGEALYQGRGLPQAPQVGDLRITYSVLPNETFGTLLGGVEAHGQISAFQDTKSGISLYRFFPSGREEAIQALKTEHNAVTWMLRCLGFFLMWFGFSLLMAPFRLLLESVPGLSATFGAVTGFAALFLCLLLTTTTVLVGKLLHSPVVMLVATLTVLALGLALLQRKEKEKAPEVPSYPIQRSQPPLPNTKKTA